MEEKSSRNEYGHNSSSQSAFMDSLLKEGTSVEDAEKKLREKWTGYKPGRFKGHVAHLKKAHLLVIENTNNVLKIGQKSEPVAA